MGRFINLFHADNLDQQYLVRLVLRKVSQLAASLSAGRQQVV